MKEKKISLGREILKALQAGPMHGRMIAAAISREYGTILGRLRTMSDSGAITVVGLAGPCGYTDARVDAQVYALPGTSPLKRSAPKTKVLPQKSGVFPVPVRERPWKTLKRNPFELRDLAMETRRR